MISATIWIPTAAALVLLVVPHERSSLMRWLALAASGTTLLTSLALTAATLTGGGLRFQERIAWLPQVGSSYHLAVDGLSAPLMALTALLTTACIVYSWRLAKHLRAYLALFLVLETGVQGVFGIQDLLLFYLFFEVSLVPMYFVIGVWGDVGAKAAALKFFLYTRFGSLAMLLGFLGLYLSVQPHTFDLPTIVAAHPYASDHLLGPLVLLALLVGFGVKLPVVPVHSWLPAAHVEAPTAGSVMLAGVLLKLGGYGLIRVALPALPGAFHDWAWLVGIVAVVSIIYGAGVAFAQRDLKRLVAFSSINHMGYVLLGVVAAAIAGVGSAAGRIALDGATLQLLSHGLITGGLFFAVGMLADRAGTRQISAFGGLARRLPLFSFITALLFFGSLGLPALSGFVAEFQVFAGTLGSAPVLAALGLVGVAVTTAMFLFVLQRLFTGEERLPEVGALAGEPGNGHQRALPWADISGREVLALAPLALLVVVIGVFPAPITTAIDGGIATWMRLVG